MKKSIITKNVIFTITAIFIVLFAAEVFMRVLDFVKKDVIKKHKTTWRYTATEKELVKIHRDRENNAVTYNRFVKLDPLMYTVIGGEYYKPKPGSTIVTIRSSRFERMVLPLDVTTQRFIDNFVGEKYYATYGKLSLRDTGNYVNSDGQENAISILMLGDSFTEGCYVDNNDTIAAYLEKEIAENQKETVQVLNAGISGYSTKEEYYRLLALLPHIRPKIIILNYFPNDLNVDEHKVVGYWKPKEPQTYIGRWIFKNSILARTLMKEYYNIFSKTDDPWKNPEIQNGWKESLYYLSKIKDMCDKARIVFVVVAIPPKEQFNFGIKAFYQKRLGDFCAENSIIFLDLYDYFEKNDPAKLYLDWDPHFTKEGNHACAVFTFDEIKKRGLLI